jgi:hypothetical protein
MAEAIKKAKTPSKAKKVVAEKAVTEKAAAQKVVAKKAAAKTGIAIMKPVVQAEVALLAHRFWAERGYNHGHHIEDWFRAEQALRGKAS